MGLELLAPTGAVHMMMQHYISWGHVFDPPETTRKTSFASVKLLTWGKFQETDSGKLQTSWPLMRAQQARLVHFYQHVLPKNSWYWVCFHVKGAAARWRRERCSNGKEVSCPRGIWSHLRWAVSRLDAFHLLRCERAPQGASSVFQPFRRRMAIDHFSSIIFCKQKCFYWSESQPKMKPTFYWSAGCSLQIINWFTLLNHNILLTDAVEWIAWSLFLPLHHCS